MHTAFVLLPRSSLAAKRLMYMAGSTIGTFVCRLRCLISFWKVYTGGAASRGAGKDEDMYIKERIGKGRCAAIGSVGGG